MARSTTVHERALTILRELQQAQADLVSKGVVLANGRAGTVDGVSLDELHGLRITVQGCISLMNYPKAGPPWITDVCQTQRTVVGSYASILG